MQSSHIRDNGQSYLTFLLPTLRPYLSMGLKEVGVKILSNEIGHPWKNVSSGLRWLLRQQMQHVLQK